MGVSATALEGHPTGSSTSDLQAQVTWLKERILEEAGKPVPASPTDQLRQAIEAVFCSWDSTRAQAYREKEGIDASHGTAVNVQAMVFGNRGDDSGTGVVFTRDPATGATGLYGDYLPRAQGEDVVAGTAATKPLSHLAEVQPDVYAELRGVLRRLEVHYRDICDVEFTVESGKLWLLQTRVGKRGAVAAVRIAVDLVHDEDIALTVGEAVTRVPHEIRERARREVLTRVSSLGHEDDLVTVGLGASPGRVSGRIVLTAESAADADDDVVLVRTETSPEDVAGMAASVGILTTKGGLVSHAAVVARGWHIPAVVGAAELTISDGKVHSTNGVDLTEGQVITIDGTSGHVWRGLVEVDDSGFQHAIEDALPELLTLESWAFEVGDPSLTGKDES
jgi:pyruvate,orthophosphate dikinase